jgi:deoxyribodipyrimidine photo-lyase
MKNTIPISICWLRRDLRLNDQAALFHALKGPHPVLPVFIFDQNILDRLTDKRDRRVEFIHLQLLNIKEQLQQMGSDLLIQYGKPLQVWKKLLETYTVAGVYTNHDYEPYAMRRDEEVNQLLAAHQVPFYTFKDQVVFEKDEVLSATGKPYTVYTPYSNMWLKTFAQPSIPSYSTSTLFPNLQRLYTFPLISLEDMGFHAAGISFPSSTTTDSIIANYAEQRNTPSVIGTSHLGIHLRFGTISVRELVNHAMQFEKTFLKELIWREFFMQILWHHPHVIDQPFKKQYDKIEWRTDEKDFEMWCQGKTGYPIVDAGMRELNETGFMHNRVRMITASFLCKHLFIDWRWGEAYFAEKLLDFELSANNGNWQWVAGTGCDAAPYFRIFNPTEQQKKFDPQAIYIRRWVKEFDSLDYPQPMVNHVFARERALKGYAVLKS